MIWVTILQTLSFKCALTNLFVEFINDTSEFYGNYYY